MGKNKIWLKKGDPRDEGGHVNSFTTSIALCLKSMSVWKDKIVDSGCEPMHWNDPNLNFADYLSRLSCHCRILPGVYRAPSLICSIPPKIDFQWQTLDRKSRPSAYTGEPEVKLLFQ